MEVVEVLKAAYEHLAQGKWIQGNFYGPEGTTCLRGAISKATGFIPENFWITNKARLYFYNLRARADSVVSDLLVEDWDCIEDFNDDPDTTLEDVLLVLKRAIHSLEEE